MLKKKCFIQWHSDVNSCILKNMYYLDNQWRWKPNISISSIICDICPWTIQLWILHHVPKVHIARFAVFLLLKSTWNRLVLKKTTLKIFWIYFWKTLHNKDKYNKFALCLGIENNWFTCYYIDIVVNVEVWVFGDISFQCIEMIVQIFI